MALDDLPSDAVRSPVDLLTEATITAAPSDGTNLASLRTRLLRALRASGWRPPQFSKVLSLAELSSPSIEEPPRWPRSATFLGPPSSPASNPCKPVEALGPEGEATLLAAFVRGDAAAFDALFERHAPKLNGWARRWLGGGDAEDAVQEAFVVLFEKAPSIVEREDVNVAGFLFTTLRYRVLRALARREVPEAEPGADEPSPVDDGLAALLRREDAGRLARLLEQACSPLEQHVVMLDLEDRADAEIAGALGIAPGYVRVTRHRAHAKLRRALAP